ncbi:MAG: carbonic anhydrase [Planctomycetaceae bacterium]|nr:carbonic anhydrase [Planctomycetaceae bacterium]
MQRLVDGVHYFRKVGFARHQELFARLGSGQNPEACFITCCDSRVDPNLITNSVPGQLFIVRNVGNIVPCHGTSNNGELAAVEFAVSELGVEDVIVCGHTGCGAMKALMSGVASPTIQKWLIHAEATREIIRERYGHLEGEAMLTAASEENVLVQMEHLRTLPVIASRLAQGRVHLHGWMFKISTGEVFAYDSGSNEFLPLRESGPGNNGRAVAVTAEAKAKVTVKTSTRKRIVR